MSFRLMSLKPPYPHGQDGKNDNSEKLKCLLWKKLEGCRVDSNHHRTGIIPIPSDRLKVRHPYIFLSAWCATTNSKAMLTDGFCFPFLLVPQTTLHIGSLCFMANCLLPHLLITGWLLTIYSNAFV